MRPLFRVTTSRDVSLVSLQTRIVPLNSLDVGHIDYDYPRGGAPAVVFRARGPSGEAYMQAGHDGYWPRVKVRFALIATPTSSQPIFAGLLRNQAGPPTFVAHAVAGRPRDPGHYFLEGEGYMQAGPGRGVSLYVEGADIVVAGSYVEFSEVPRDAVRQAAPLH